MHPFALDAWPPARGPALVRTLNRPRYQKQAAWAKRPANAAHRSPQNADVHTATTARETPHWQPIQLAPFA